MEKSEVNKENEMSVPKTSIKTNSLQTESSTMEDFDAKSLRAEEGRGKNRDPLQITTNMAITYQNAASTSQSLHSAPFINFTIDVGALLPHFTGYNFDMRIWVQRVDAVQMAYTIPDNVMTAVVAGKLQEVAYLWFHFKVEHASMPWNMLKMKLIDVFHTSLKQGIMQQFLSRKWCKKEDFMKYYFNKIELGSGIGISETDMIRHMINGLDCPTVIQNKKKKYNSVQELFKDMQDFKKPRKDKKRKKKRVEDRFVENEKFLNMILSIVCSEDSNNTTKAEKDVPVCLPIARNLQVITGASTEDDMPTGIIEKFKQAHVSSYDKKNSSKVSDGSLIIQDELKSQKSMDRSEINNKDIISVSKINSTTNSGQYETLSLKGVENFHEDKFKKDNENIQLEDPIQATKNTALYQSAVSSSVNIDFGALLPYFNSKIYDVHVWIQRVDAVQMIYNIPNDVMTVIVAGKLQEFTQIWFHSKVEHNAMPWNILKRELINMFNKISNKKRLMNRFRARKWVRNETFQKYYVDKVTLGTGIGVDETNMIQYVIDGFDNANLQNSTRLKNFNSLHEMFHEMRDVKKPKNEMIHLGVQSSLGKKIIKNTHTSVIRPEDSNTTVKNKTKSAGINPLSYRENSEFSEDVTPVLLDFMPSGKTETSEKTFEVSAGPLPVVQVKKKKPGKLCRYVQRILNIITPETFDKYLTEIRFLNIYTIHQMEGVVNVIYKTAVNVPRYSAIYAHISGELAHMQIAVHTTKGDSETKSFGKLLISKCQLEFEKNIHEIERNDKLQEIETCTDPVKKKELQLFQNNYDVMLQMRSVGNVSFIGELFKQQLLPMNIIIGCLYDLLGIKNDKSLECLCILLKVAGKELEIKNVDLSKIFEELNNICIDTSISTRVRHMIQDVITLQSSNWIPRIENPNL